MILLSQFITNTQWNCSDTDVSLCFDVQCENTELVSIRTYKDAERGWMISLKAGYANVNECKRLDWGEEFLAMLVIMKSVGIDHARISDILRFVLTAANRLDRVEAVDDALARARNVVIALETERTQLRDIGKAKDADPSV